MLVPLLQDNFGNYNNIYNISDTDVACELFEIQVATSRELSSV